MCCKKILIALRNHSPFYRKMLQKTWVILDKKQVSLGKYGFPCNKNHVLLDEKKRVVCPKVNKDFLLNILNHYFCLKGIVGIQSREQKGPAHFWRLQTRIPEAARDP